MKNLLLMATSIGLVTTFTAAQSRYSARDEDAINGVVKRSQDGTFHSQNLVADRYWFIFNS